MSIALPGMRQVSASGALLFALLCLIWGSTWLSLEVGIALVPPLLFSALRFLLAGLVLLGLAAGRGRLRVGFTTVVPAAVLMIAVNYGLMAWGMTRVSSGVAAVTNLSMVPMATLVLSVAYGWTGWSVGAAASLVAGAAGLCLLLGPDFGTAGTAGVTAIAIGAACYAWGAILIKQQPVADPVTLAAWQCLLGGAILGAAALLTEPFDAGTLAAAGAAAALGNLVFLASASVIGGTVYLMLLARWEASRVAAYAYVCPLIALGEGALLDARLPTRAELAAVLLLLIATRFSLIVAPCEETANERTRRT